MAARPCTSPTCTSRCAGRHSDRCSPSQWSTRSSDCPTHSSIRSSSKTSSTRLGRAADQHVGVHEREVADEDRHAFAESSGLAAPACGVGGAPRSARCTASRSRRMSEPSMTSSCTSAKVCTSSSAAAAVDHVWSLFASPPLPTNAQWQNAGRSRLPPAATSIRSSVERIDEHRVDDGPALDLGVEQREDARLDPFGDADERGGERRFAPVHAGRITRVRPSASFGRSLHGSSAPRRRSLRQAGLRSSAR